MALLGGRAQTTIWYAGREVSVGELLARYQATARWLKQAG